MGVGASLFTNFLLNPPDDYDILAVQTPGRENRMAEPVAESVDQLGGSDRAAVVAVLRSPGGDLGAQFRRHRGPGGHSPPA